MNQTCLQNSRISELPNDAVEQDKSMSEKDYLIKKNSDDVNYRVYWYRWYILFQFSYLSLLQTGVAGTWSPINLSAEKAYNLTKRDFVLLANWGSAGLLIFLPVDMWVIMKYGMRPAVFAGTICMLLGTGVRCLPLGVNKKYAIHIGQLLNGIAGCPVLGAAPYISNTWFPLKDRVLATGFMLLTGNLGGIMSYLLGPYMVEEPNNSTQYNVTDNTNKIRHEIETYLLIEFGMALLLFVMMLTFFPNKPPHPPSASASVARLDFLVGLKVLLKNRTYWILVTVFCGIISSFYCWSGIMPLLYIKRGISQKTTGLIGTVMSAAGIIVGSIFCWFADRARTYVSKLWVVTVILAYVFCLYIVAISMKWIPVPPFTFTLESLWIAMLCLGTSIYTAQSLGMELAADIAYPVNEGTANYIIMWLVMLVNVIYLSALSFIKNQDVAFYMMLGMMSLAPPLLYFTIPKTNARLQLDLAISPSNS